MVHTPGGPERGEDLDAAGPDSRGGGTRYGEHALTDVLVRAPGALLARGVAPDGGPALLQVVPLRAPADDAERAARDAYVKMAEQATALLAEADGPAALAHGAAEHDGELALYWALPWGPAAERIGRGAEAIESPEHLAQAASALLERTQRLHEAGRLDPLLSADVVALRPGAGLDVLGLPIHLPPDWTSPSLPPAPFAPEEDGEPSRAGDLWRVGATLRDLAAGLESAPANLVRVIERLLEDDPAKRFGSAEEALIEVEALQSTVATSREDFERDQGAEADAAARAAADLVQEELLEQATVAMDSDAASLDPDPDTEPEDVAEDEDEDEDESLDIDTSPNFPSPIAGERTVADKELATVRLPFPKEPLEQARAELAAERGVPPGRVTHVAAPSAIPEGETLLDVRRPLPPAATTVDAPGAASSEQTLQDVALQDLARADDEFPTMDEVPPARRGASWDRAKKAPPFDPTRPRPRGEQPLPPKTAPLGPRGTVVGARIINDPTGMRMHHELPGMLPPPHMAQGAPLEDLSSDLEAPPPAALPPPAAAPPPALAAPPPASPPLGPPQGAQPGLPPPTPAQPLAPPSSAPPASSEAAPPPSPVATAPGPSSSSPGVSASPAWTPEPPARRSKLNVLLGAVGFFVAGGLAALAAPYLMSGEAATDLGIEPTPPPAPVYAATAVNEVLLQASPASAVVVSELDGRVLGRTPARFLVPPGLDVAVYVAAQGHEPQRVPLPERGRIRTDLVPLRDASPCEVELDVPARVSVEGVAADVQRNQAKYSVPGAALLRAKIGEGAWLVRCPRLGGASKQVLPPRALPERAKLGVIGPTNATIYVDGEEIGTTPLEEQVATGFREVAVEKLSAGRDRATRWIPILGETKIRMPRPRGD